MRYGRMTRTGIALLATAAIGVAGCGSNGGSASPDATLDPTSSAAPTGTGTAADAREALAAAAMKLGEQSVRVKMTTTGMTGTGVMDPKTRMVEMTMDMGGQQNMELRALGDDFYMRMPGLTGDKWMHIDITKYSDSANLNFMPDGDPGSAAKTMENIVDVKQTGDGRYAGTIDMTKAEGANAAAAALLGDGARAVPFTASVDPQGRLTSFEVDMSVVNSAAGKLSTTYSDFGVAVNVQRPPADQVQEAPSTIPGFPGN